MPLGMRWWLALVGFYAAFVVNPMFISGCGDSEPGEPQFGEQEMLELLAAVNGPAEFTFTADGDEYLLTISVEQVEGEDVLSAAPPSPQLLGQRAHACGDRTFRQTASACLTVTSMPVEGTITLERLDGGAAETLLDAIAVTGDLHTYGKTLSGAELSLEFHNGHAALYSDDATEFQLDAFESTDVDGAGGGLSY